MGLEMLEDEGNEPHGVGLTDLVSERDVGDSGCDVTECVLIPGHFAPADGIPQVVDVVEVFDVKLATFEDFHPLAFFCQLSSLTPSLLASFDETVGVEDAVDGGGG